MAAMEVARHPSQLEELARRGHNRARPCRSGAAIPSGRGASPVRSRPPAAASSSRSRASSSSPGTPCLSSAKCPAQIIAFCEILRYRHLLDFKRTARTRRIASRIPASETRGHMPTKGDLMGILYQAADPIYWVIWLFVLFALMPSTSWGASSCGAGSSCSRSCRLRSPCSYGPKPPPPATSTARELGSTG